jgi:hypothetical protein
MLPSCPSEVAKKSLKINSNRTIILSETTVTVTGLRPSNEKTG